MNKLLTLCGYNSALSFKLISEGALDSMEKFIEQNHRNVADTFEEYKNVKPFKFLPGHVALIFGIKKQIEDFFHDNKKPKKGAKVDIIQNEDELQANLLHQLSVFTKNLKLDAVWTKNCIKDSTFTATENASFCTCTISCCLCGSPFAVRYDKYWKNSNIYKHMRNHLNSMTSETTKGTAPPTNPENQETIYLTIMQSGSANEEIIYSDYSDDGQQI